MQNWKIGGDGSVWNIFQQRANLDDDLKEILDEVNSVKKVSMSSRASILEMMQIKSTSNQGAVSETQKKESIYWKTGENLLTNETELEHRNSPLRGILLGIGNLLQSVAEEHAQFENNVQASLGSDTAIHHLVTKEYPNLQKEEDILRKKQKEQENVQCRFSKEKQKLELASDDLEFAEDHCTKEVRLKEDLQNVTRETTAAEDKFVTSLYSLQAKEKEFARNLVESIKSLQTYFEKVSHKLNEKVPKLEAIINNSKKSKTFGEDLETHLRVQNLKIALPLQLGVESLKGKLKEEGLFRVSPSLPSLQKMKASIDAGVSKSMILRKYKDPHLYSSVIKHYLRELPDPLLCSSLVNDWKSVDRTKNELEKQIGIKALLEKVPEANMDNISFVIGFLAKLEKEKKFNKMTIENIIVVLSPNLLWDSNGIHIPIGSVYKSMLENYEFIFGSSDFDYDEIENFETEEIETRIEPTNETFLVKKRSSFARTAIRENRKRYQTRSSTEGYKLQSMGSSFEDTTEYLNLINQSKVVPVRKTESRKLNEERNEDRISFVRSYSAMDQKILDEKDETQCFFTQPVEHCEIVAEDNIGYKKLNLVSEYDEISLGSTPSDLNSPLTQPNNSSGWK